MKKSVLTAGLRAAAGHQSQQAPATAAPSATKAKPVTKNLERIINAFQKTGERLNWLTKRPRKRMGRHHDR
jgi:hypothetical protein